MAFYVSPGVYVIEKDISNIVPAISTTIGALVGYSHKGALDVQLITNRQQFVQEYGEPVPGNYFHYSALAFLEHGSQLYCRRVVNSPLYGGMHVVKSDSNEVNMAFDIGQATLAFYNQSGFDDEVFSVMAKDPGAWNNNIQVIIKNVKDNTEAEVTEQYTFEIDVYFVDSDGISSKVETWKVSRKHKKDGYGRQLYMEDKINRYSAYINVKDNTVLADTVLPKENSTTVTFSGGSDGLAITASTIVGTAGAKSGWYGFADAEDVDIRLMIDGGYTSDFTASDIAIIQIAMIAIAEARKDCIALLSVPESEEANNIDALAYRNTTLNANSSYAGLYIGHCVINDAYNDRILNIPPSGYAAGAICYNDAVGKTWNAPAGFNRGRLNVLSCTRTFNQGDRDALYPKGMNPIQVFRGEGVVLWGQKTMQVKASRLDRINVRRLLITIEKSMSVSLRYFAFEPTTELTWFRITGMMTQYLDRIASQGGFQTEYGDNGFYVKCDNENNTPSVTDDNQINVDVFIKPVGAGEFIQLQTIVTTSGASFEELISRGVML
jgi:phage tail sheath protein FI